MCMYVYTYICIYNDKGCFGAPGQEPTVICRLPRPLLASQPPPVAPPALPL